MGYLVDMSINLYIAKDQLAGLYEAMKAYNEAHNCANAGDVVSELGEWGFESSVNDKTGDIEAIRWAGQKWRDQEDLFILMAPFVTTGSTVRCVGEDAHVWGYEFLNGKLWGTTCQMVLDGTPIA